MIIPSPTLGVVPETYVITWLSVTPSARFSYRLHERIKLCPTEPPPAVGPNVVGKVVAAVAVAVAAVAPKWPFVAPFAVPIPPPFVNVVVVEVDVLCMAMFLSKPCELFHNATAMRKYSICNRTNEKQKAWAFKYCCQMALIKDEMRIERHSDSSYGVVGI